MATADPADTGAIPKSSPGPSTQGQNASGAEVPKFQKATKAKPTVILILGMAGSGKTTFTQRLMADMYARATGNSPSGKVSLNQTK